MPDSVALVGTLAFGGTALYYFANSRPGLTARQGLALAFGCLVFGYMLTALLWPAMVGGFINPPNFGQEPHM